MNDEFVTNVLTMMMGMLSQELCGKLKEALYISLQEYTLEKRCTELLDLDRSYIQNSCIFIIRFV